MATLHIEHPISDFPVWCAAFKRFSRARAEAGVRAARVFRPVDDPHYVVVALDFDTADEAHAFHHFLQTRVWSDPDNSPALVGAPLARVLQAEAVD